MSQKEMVRKYLEENGSITSIECFEKLKIVDLQKAIQLLRKENYRIIDTWIHKKNCYGKPVKFKKYILEV
jgi:hypothetical protein